MEVEDKERRAMDYFPLDERVHFSIVADWEGMEGWEAKGPVEIHQRGQTGRVLFHRLDESCLLVNMLERDEAEMVAPSAAALALGGCVDGLRNPRPPANLAGSLQPGLY